MVGFVHRSCPMDARQAFADEPLDDDLHDEPVDQAPLSAGQRRRFEQLYLENRDAVTRMLRSRLPNEDDVAEVVQEAFLRLLRYRRCGLDSLRYLLFKVASNVAVNRLRQAGVRQMVSLDDCELVSQEPPADQRLLQEEEITQVAMAIQALPARCRQAYVMNRLRGVRQREIAEHCGISTRMVEMRIARANVLIRERMAALPA